MYFQGLEATKTTKQLTAWLGDEIDVLDAYGTKRFSGTVVAKSVREWDMSKPIGSRLVSQKITKDFKTFHELTKETYRRLTGKHC